MRKLVLIIALTLGCSGTEGADLIAPPPAPPPPPPPAAPVVGPTNVILTSAAVTDLGLTDLLTLAVQNGGGTGDFYLEFWGEVNRTAPSGCTVVPPQTTCPHPAQVIIAISQAVNVTAGYSETVYYNITGTVSSVRVLSRAINVTPYSRSSCKTVRDYGACP